MLKPILTAALIAVALLASGQPARAADTSGTLVVRGSVAAVCTVSIQDMGARLDLVAGAKNVVVGKVTETCNDGDGYTVTFTSQGKGNLVNGNAQVAYTVDYDGAANASLGSDLRLNRKDAVFGAVKELKVSVDGSAARVAGSYADTITVTIAAN